jgi:hypothetical protein
MAMVIEMIWEKLHFFNYIKKKLKKEGVLLNLSLHNTLQNTLHLE